MEREEARSLAFERRGNRLVVRLDDAVPRVKMRNQTYYVTEGASITVGGKKYFVEEIV